MLSINRVYSTIRLIIAALTARGAAQGSAALLKNGVTVSANGYRGAIEALSTIPASSEFSVTFANTYVSAAPFLLWNLKMRGFSGCIAKTDVDGIRLELRR